MGPHSSASSSSSAPSFSLSSSSSSSSSADGTAETESAAAAARAKALVAVQERLQTGGLLLYGGAFLIDGGSTYWIDHTDPDGENPHDETIFGWYELAYALAQTAGLLLMGVANGDADLHMRRRPILAATVAVVVVAYSGLQAVGEGTDRLDLVSVWVRECGCVWVCVWVRAWGEWERVGACVGVCG